MTLTLFQSTVQILYNNFMYSLHNWQKLSKVVDPFKQLALLHRFGGGPQAKSLNMCRHCKVRNESWKFVQMPLITPLVELIYNLFCSELKMNLRGREKQKWKHSKGSVYFHCQHNNAKSINLHNYCHWLSSCIYGTTKLCPFPTNYEAQYKFFILNKFTFYPQI